MNEQEFQLRRRQILGSIDGHVPSRRSPVSEKALGVASRFVGYLMLAPSLLAGALASSKYWETASAAASQTPPSYFSALVVFLTISLVASIALFFAVTFAALRFVDDPVGDDPRAASRFLDPFAAATRSTARALLARLGLGVSITPAQAGRLTAFVAANPGLMDVVSSWASKNPLLQFTGREMACIDRVSRRLAKLDTRWAAIQLAAARRHEINALLDKAGIAARVAALAQSDSMSAATPPSTQVSPPSRF